MIGDRIDFGLDDPGTRPASHAGSWYPSDPVELSNNLDEYLSKVDDVVLGIRADSRRQPPVTFPVEGARVILAPHAGYSYSGETAAWAYKALDLSKARRIFLIGPSHHWTKTVLRVTSYDYYATPLGPLKIDQEVNEELLEFPIVGTMSKENDISEHSLELHLPFIYKMLSRQFGSADSFPTLVPILVGLLSDGVDKIIGEILEPYLADQTSIFIVSSDFCHWGPSFDYGSLWLNNRLVVGYEVTGGMSENQLSNTILTGISGLDHLAMDAIETGQPEEFSSVIEDTENTVCGRYPIKVMMATALRHMFSMMDGKAVDMTGRFRFVKYAKSTDKMTLDSSSVSYCSAFMVI